MQMAMLSVMTEFGLQRIPVGVIDSGLATDQLGIGQGFDTAFGRMGMPQTVEFNYTDDELTTIAGAGGNSTNYILEAYTDFASLESSLNISAAASLGFGIYSGSATYNFISSEQHTRFDSYLLVGVRVSNVAKVLKRAHLSPAALKLAASGQRLFQERCGSSYVYGVRLGGELLAVYRYSATSDEQAQSVRLEVEAAAKGYGSGSLSMSSAVKSVSKHTSTSYHLLRNGGLGDIPDIDHLIEAAAKFPDQVKQSANATVLSTLVRSYRAVDNLPIHGISLSAIEKQARTVDEIAAQLVEARNAHNDWKLVAANRPNFVLADDPDKQIQNALNQIDQAVKALANDVDAVDKDPTFELTAPAALPDLPAPVPPIIPPPFVIVELFDQPNFGGRRLKCYSDIHNFQSTDVGDINDQVRSFRVNGVPGEYRVTFYVDADYQGGSYTYTSPVEKAETFMPFGGQLPYGASSMRMFKQ